MKSCGLSHQGYYRLANEDAYLVQDELKLYIVADGIGSMRESSVASDLLVNPFAAHLAGQNFADRLQSVKWELLRRHHCLYQQSQKRGNAIGATLALLLAAEDKAGILWAGDSRVYGYSPLQNSFIQLTEDDVSGRAITRAVGVEPELVLNQKIFRLNGGERFLLCTDGLYKKVTDTEMHFMLKHTMGVAVCQKLIALALKREVKDNITAVIYDAA